MIQFSSKIIVAFGMQSIWVYFEQIPVDKWVPLDSLMDSNLLHASFPLVHLSSVHLLCIFCPVSTEAFAPVQAHWAKIVFGSECISGPLALM